MASWTLIEPSVKKAAIQTKKTCKVYAVNDFHTLYSEKCKAETCTSLCIKAELGEDDKKTLGSKLFLGVNCCNYHSLEQMARESSNG